MSVLDWILNMPNWGWSDWAVWLGSLSVIGFIVGWTAAAIYYGRKRRKMK